MNGVITTEHVSPLLLWQCLCGGGNLTSADHQHVILCEQCETLADEIAGALDDLQKTLGRRQPSLSANPDVS
jgi:hypothetical protein